MRNVLYGFYLVVVSAVSIAFALDAGGVQSALVALLGNPFYSGAGGLVLAMAVAPFPTDPVLTAIAVAYKNASYIADQVLRRVPVLRQEFKYMVFDKRDTMTIPETRVGRRSQPNEVDFGATEATGSCDAHGLDDPIPQDDIDNAAGTGHDPRATAVAGLSELILLAREKRVADLVFNTASYAASSNRTQLSGNHQWSVSHADADPIPDINNALDACVMRPNVMVLGQAAWLGLRTNANIVKAINKSSGDKGMATRQAVADLFELDDVLVGQAWYNTVKKGQTASLSRLWGKHCALLCIDKTDMAGKRITFGYTAQWGGRIAGAEPDSRIGLKGGMRVRVGEYVKELVTATDLGYFIQDCVA